MLGNKFNCLGNSDININRALTYSSIQLGEQFAAVGADIFCGKPVKRQRLHILNAAGALAAGLAFKHLREFIIYDLFHNIYQCHNQTSIGEKRRGFNPNFKAFVIL